MNGLDLIQHNRDVYDRIAPYFSATREFIWADVEPWQKYIKPGASVLDLGCGNGRLYQMLAKKQVQYIGLDQSEVLIKIGEQKFPEVKFIVGEMSTLPFANETFDVIFCVAALNHIPGRELQLACLAEMRRVLKNNGKLLMTNWNLFSIGAQRKAKQHHWKITPGKIGEGIDVMVPWKNSVGEILGERYYHGFTMDELKNLLIDTGFEINDQYYSRKGERVELEDGGNLMSVASKLWK